MRCALAFAVLLLWACGTVHTTDPARTATEQFLMTVSVQEAVRKLSPQALGQRLVYVDGSRLKTYIYKNNLLTEQDPSPEQRFLVGEVRARLLQEGVKLTDTAEKAEVIVDVSSGGIGIDRYETIIGVPALYVTGLPEPLGAAVTQTPDIALYKRKMGLGVGDVGLAAYWAKTGELIALSHPPPGFGDRKDIRYLLVVERKTGNVPTIQRPEE